MRSVTGFQLTRFRSKARFRENVTSLHVRNCRPSLDLSLSARSCLTIRPRRVGLRQYGLNLARSSLPMPLEFFLFLLTLGTCWTVCVVLRASSGTVQTLTSPSSPPVKIVLL